MASESTDTHRREAEAFPPARVAVLTISDTRTEENDTSGRLIMDRLESKGHSIAKYHILPDDPSTITEAVAGYAEDDSVDVVITNGGTGIASRDGTFEAVKGLLERTLPGFGEIFRMLSYHEVGAASMLSRAIAGTHRSTIIFCLPGSTNAVTLAMDKLINPELAHLVYELKHR